MKKLLIALTFIAIVMTGNSALAVREDESEPTPTPKTNTSVTATVPPAKTTPPPRTTTYTKEPAPTPPAQNVIDRTAATGKLQDARPGATARPVTTGALPSGTVVKTFTPSPTPTPKK